MYNLYPNNNNNINNQNTFFKITMLFTIKHYYAVQKGK